MIVDEVLAVGDSTFQKKCLGKMGDVALQGRTVLFVSHNMSAIENLTHQCILLQSGQIAFNGITSDAVTLYLKAASESNSQSIQEWQSRSGSERDLA